MARYEMQDAQVGESSEPCGKPNNRSFLQKPRLLFHRANSGTSLGLSEHTHKFGEMSIELEAQVYSIPAGSMVVVNPRTVHKVIREGTFLAFVITANCGGTHDKVVVEE